MAVMRGGWMVAQLAVSLEGVLASMKVAWLAVCSAVWRVVWSAAWRDEMMVAWKVG